MQTRLKALVIGLVSSLCLGEFKYNAVADVGVSLGLQINATADFYVPLEPHGAWVEVSSYGRCWRPARVAVGWRPYCDGHWVWTDVGWYWVSDEPWAWATYHYGSWSFDSEFGWVWVPGIEWAPAWVYWRVGDGYCGWAPRSPRGGIAAPSLFVFVETRHFHERVRPTTVIVNNTTIINKTTSITKISRETRDIGGTKQKVVINEGPGIAMVEKATSKKINPVPIREAVRETPVPSPVQRKIQESSGAKKAPVIHEKQPEPARPSVEPRPNSSPNRGNAPTKVVPPHPSALPGSPVKPGGSPEEKEKGRGHKDKP